MPDSPIYLYIRGIEKEMKTEIQKKYFNAILQETQHKEDTGNSHYNHHTKILCLKD